MIDHDATLSSPAGAIDCSALSALALTVIWHPDLARVGEQYLSDSPVVELSRHMPLFCRPGGAASPLGHACISRDCLRFVRDGKDNVTITLPASRMVAQLAGRVIEGTAQLTAAQIAAGQILTLGRAIVLCVHWMGVVPRHDPVPGLVGVGSSAIALREQVRMVASTTLPVLLLGETGTGKEVVARAIHALSERSGARLVTVNMAALSESLALADLFGAVKGAYTGAQAERKGLFAEAEHATLFLDEIGNAPASIQPMLLRVLEGGDFRPLGATHDRRATARLIAATDQDLDAATFNQALLRRLESFTIQLPPLRARREDIGVLIVHLLPSRELLAALPGQFVTEIACHDWPGNVRQLAHTLRRAALQLQCGGTLQLDQLMRVPGAALAPPPAPAAPPRVVPGPPREDASQRKKPADLSDQDVLDAMLHNGWTIKAAAAALGISRPSLYKLLEGHPHIRRLEHIPAEELAQSIAHCGGNMARCAAQLKTPVEPLRRHIHRHYRDGGHAAPDPPRD